MKRIAPRAYSRYVLYVQTLPHNEQYELMTTDFKAKTQAARLRRLMIKEFNSKERMINKYETA